MNTKPKTLPSLLSTPIFTSSPLLAPKEMMIVTLLTLLRPVKEIDYLAMQEEPEVEMSGTAYNGGPNMLMRGWVCYTFHWGHQEEAGGI